MAFIRGANVVTDGIVWVLDAANPKSYISGSTIWNDLSGNNISGSLFSSSFANNSIVYNGTSSYTNIANLVLSGSFTINVLLSPNINSDGNILQNRQTIFADNSGSFDGRGIELSSTSSISFKNMGVYLIEDYPISNLSNNVYTYLTIVRNDFNRIQVYTNGNRTDLDLSLTEIPYLITIDSLANSLQSSFLSGSISQITAYNRALSETEIRQNLNAVGGKFDINTFQSPQNIPNTLITLLQVRALLESSTFEAPMISSSLADLNRLNSLGLLESASLVVTPATFKEGLLYNIKPKKSTYNLLKFTQDFTPAGWTFINTSASLGYIAPDSSSTATLFTVTGSGTVRMNQSVTLTANHPYNISWYVSQSNTRYANIIFGDIGEAQTAATQIDFQTQTFSIKNPGTISFNPRNLTLQSLPNSWYRASYTVTPTASLANYKMTVIPTTSSIGAYATSISSSIYFWGAQITKGEEVLPYQRIVSASTPDGVYTRTTTTTAIDRNGYVSAYPYNLVVNTTNGLLTAAIERNAALAPDGTYTADKFTKTGNLFITQDISVDSVSPHSGSQWNISFYTKLADTGSNISMPIEIYPVSGSSFLTQTQPSAYTITNQWQRIERTFSATEPLINYFSVRVARETSTTGPLIGRSFHIWGVQLTKGSGSLPFQKNTSRLNWPTIDYSAGAPALRTTPAAENYLRWSNNLGNGVWIKNNMNVTLTSSLSPSGERNSFVLTAVSASASIKQSPNMNTRVPQFSVYMKRKTGTGNVFLEVGPFSSSIQPTSDWGRYQRPGFRISGSYTASAGTYTVTTSVPHGLQSGEFQGFGTGTNFTQINAIVSSVTDNFTYVFTSGTTTASGSCTIVANVGRIRLETQGDEVEVWGPQLEGTGYVDNINNFTTSSLFSYVKDFVPTTTTNVTRGTETLALNDLSSSILSNANSGSFYGEFAIQHTTNAFFTGFEFLNLFNISGSKVFSLWTTSTSFPQAYRWRYDPQGNFYTISTNSFPLNTFTKMVIVYTTTSLKFFANGAQVGSTLTLTTPVDLRLDKIGVGGYLLTKAMAYYPFTLTDAQAISLTS